MTANTEVKAVPTNTEKQIVAESQPTSDTPCATTPARDDSVRPKTMTPKPNKSTPSVQSWSQIGELRSHVLDV